MNELELIEKCKQFLTKNESEASSPRRYLCSWAPITGYYQLKILNNFYKGIFDYSISIFKDLFRYGLYSELIVLENLESNLKYDVAMITYAMKSDFKDGKFIDRYIHTHKYHHTALMMILISIDGNPPEELPVNSVYLYRNKSFNLIKIFSRFIKKINQIIKFKLSDNYYFCSISREVYRTLELKDIKTVITMYEAQPFQQALNYLLKKNKSNIVSLGYMHSSLPSLPTDFIYREGMPDKLLVHGSGQKSILVENLGWPENKIETIISLRYKEMKLNFSEKILIPNAFESIDQYLMGLNDYFSKLADKTCIWSIRNHPTNIGHKKHELFINEIQKILDKYSHKFSAEIRNKTIVFGVSASIMEALESGLEVIHICNNPLYEAHSPRIWKELKVDSISKNVYFYQIIKKTTYINIVNNDINPISKILEFKNQV